MAKTKPYAGLEFEKKNKDILKPPKRKLRPGCLSRVVYSTQNLTCVRLSDARIEKRPIPHPPAASPYAGANVPKVVYVSTKTPFMSAAKRVQKLLREAEKRVTRKIKLTDRGESDKNKLEHLKKTSEALQKEEVLVKATGRAIDKAVNVGKWFEEKDAYNVEVKTGTVMVVDDIVEDEEKKERLKAKKEAGSDGGKGSKADDESDNETPETRTRWVNKVEIIVTLK